MSNFHWNPAGMNEAIALAGAGLRAATIFVANQTKEVLSVPAPRVRLTNRFGAKVYRAGWKLGNQTWQASPYAAGSRIVSESNWRFPAGGIGAPARSVLRYRTAPAIKGDPPRKLSGNLRRKITYEFLGEIVLFEGTQRVPTVGRVGTNVKYAKPLEFHRNKHEFLSRVVTKYRPQIEAIIAETV